MFEGLPEYCFARHNTTGKLIKIRRGVSGYYPFDHDLNVTDERVDELNEELGISKAQKEAMVIGSMFGWNVPGANPKMHEGRI
jgi:hypothetical protein